MNAEDMQEKAAEQYLRIAAEQDKLKQWSTWTDAVARHEKEILELKRLVTPMMEFSAEQKGVRLTDADVEQLAVAYVAEESQSDSKCAVKDCESRISQEYFNGFLCIPCHQFVSGEGGLNSKAYWNSRKMIDTAIEMERGRVAKLLEYLDMKAQPYHSYYKHAAKVINGKQEEGGLI